jgi:predicted Rossmann fold nucleotide-binding protein DprA/Smf involved in DNA uptake
MSALTIATLTSHLIPSPSPVSAALWRDIRDHAPALDLGLLDWARGALSPQNFAIVEARLALSDEVARLLEDLEEDGIRAITESAPDYPSRWREKLGSKCPPLLFVAGNASYLNTACVGVVGSRDVDQAGSEFTEEIASEIGRLGYTVVSGGARGVDQISMRRAFEAENPSVGILADSMSKTVRSSRQALESGLVCLATPFSPSAPFQVGNAMGRNKLVYGLSSGTVVVASSEGSGGTWAGAIEAMELRLCPVLVRSGADVPDGNRELIRKGATPIGSASELEGLLAEAPMEQGSLF